MLDGQIALVTGASRGIGQGIALHLGRQGAKVVGTATTAEGAARISDYLAKAGIEGMGVAMDVNQPEQVSQALAAIAERYGSVTILVNNAGITRDTLLMRMKEEQWDEVLDTNLKSAWRLSQAVLKDMMKARYGRIISIASVVGATGNAGQVNYAAAKAGLMGFTKSLAKEVGSRNITVNCVAPGFIDTDMTRALTEDQRQALLAHVPAGRLGAVEDIAAAVGYLASREAGYVTGTTLHVNGGMYMA